MENSGLAPGELVVIGRSQLQRLFDHLKQQAYSLIGPTIHQQAIVYDEIDGVADLPAGWGDVQEAGTYRLQQRHDERLFAYAVGPHSWKKYLYPPSLKLFEANSNGRLQLTSAQRPEDAPRYAFIGVRGCEMVAMHIQDRVFLRGAYHDPTYRAVREKAFILGVNCSVPAATCFCASTGSGPHCCAGFDLSLTELQHGLLFEIGSELGAEMLAACDWRPAAASELEEARRMLAAAEARMSRALQTGDLPDLLFENLDHPRWDEVAARCLSCGNCTMVCPTCFCHSVEDVSDLSGAQTARVRHWDSCFNPDFSYVYGGNVRPNIRARYRQWLTHKLASWVGQFGVSGCTGCGRCIAWCPAAIDLTAEVAAIRATSPAKRSPNYD